jgi:hypothetical protein
VFFLAYSYPLVFSMIRSFSSTWIVIMERIVFSLSLGYIFFRLSRFMLNSLEI